MGKGDKKTRKGKIFMGSYGITRTRNKKKSVVVINKKKAVTAKSTAPKEAAVVKSAKGGSLPVQQAGSGGKEITKKAGLRKLRQKARLEKPQRQKSESGTGLLYHYFPLIDTIFTRSSNHINPGS